MEIYDVDFFLNLFSPIPEELWRSGGWGDDGIHCAGGHCGIRSGEDIKTNIKFNSLENLLKKLKVKLLPGTYSPYVTIIINDRMAVEYQQPTQKQRMLAALQDIKKMQQPKHKDITHELAVLPVEEDLIQFILFNENVGRICTYWI